MKQKKIKPKYDKWFLVVLAILLWTLTGQLFTLASQLPNNWSNLNMWCKVIACTIALYGNIWVIRMYISNIKIQARRKNRIAQAIKEHPELESIINEITRG